MRQQPFSQLQLQLAEQSTPRLTLETSRAAGEINRKFREICWAEYTTTAVQQKNNDLLQPRFEAARSLQRLD